MIQAKVIHIITKMELGGSQQNTLYTVTHLNRNRFEPFLITGTGGDLFEDTEREFKPLFVVPDLIREVNPIKDFKALCRTTKIISSICNSAPCTLPCIVHTHGAKAGILGRWAARMSGIPIVIHSFHSFGFNDYQPFWLKQFYIMLERLTAPITKWTITVSKANRDQGIRLKIINPDRSTVIRSGIDIAHFRNPSVTKSETRQSLGLTENAPVITMIACLKPQKAPLDFVRACSTIKRAVPEAHFLLVGDGVLRPQVTQAVADCGLEGSFHLLGWRRDISALLQATNVLALSSLWEGLPRVLPQAMAAGIPAVATSVDGSPEAIRDSVNGFLVAPGDVAALSEKIIYLIKHPQEAKKMGARGSDFVGEFDMHAMVTDQENLYEKLLAEYATHC